MSQEMSEEVGCVSAEAIIHVLLKLMHSIVHFMLRGLDNFILVNTFRISLKYRNSTYQPCGLNARMYVPLDI